MALISCPECKKEISENATTCPNCGYALQKQTTDNVVKVSVIEEQNSKSQGDGKVLAAFILSLIITIGLGILLLPLAWQIPMTVHTWSIYKGKCKCSVAFGVCTLLFLNLISGILLLVSVDD